jgi:serine/threonine-protein kinase
MERLREVVADEYEVLALLGGVFLAQERRLKRRVALKVMSPEMMLGHNMIDRFHQEAVTQANLEHPNIAAVYLVREQGGLNFFAMQYVPGRTLQGALRFETEAERHLAIPVILTLLHQIGSALEYAHGAGVIHRDVKPGNVLLAADGRAVVTDFGIAKVAEGPALTVASTVQGTAAYMSPEQCYAAELSGASDQYSLGILAWELVTGRVPFTGDSFSVMQAHVGQVPPELTTVRADCPPALSAAVARMLSKRVEDRFPTLHAALDAMGAVPLSPRRDDPIRRELIRLADCDGMLQSLGEEVRRAMLTPRSSEQVAISDPGRSSGVRTAPSTAPPMVTAVPPVTGAGRRVSVEITPHPAVIALGERLMLGAVCRDERGAPVAAPVTWRVDAPTVASVDPTGALVARQWGRVRVRAEAAGSAVESLLIVGVVPLRRIEVLGLPATIAVGSEATADLRLVDMEGRERAIPVALSSSDPRVLAAEAPSTVRGVAAGRAELIVTCGTYEERMPLGVRAT